MTLQYEAFCLGDPLFYDAPARARGEPYAVARQTLPEGWRRDVNDEWVMHMPPEASLPQQGWKVHVSAGMENAERVIDKVSGYCLSRQLGFKFLRSHRTVLARNGKYAGRGGSGKVVTLYPRDELELEAVCRDLDDVLRGEHGPYILSDLRWAAGPVHVRYGGFAPRYTVDDRGETVPAISDPDGTLVPDVRSPVFSVPPWVELPECLVPHLAARQAVTVTDIPYTVDEAFHFSNGGGVYLGTDKRSGSRVVLKEARPHAGLAADGSDAVARLRHERDVLERLACLDAVPRLLDYLTLGDHEFLVMEHIEGDVLNQALADRYPLAGGPPDEAALADHTRWAVALHAQVAQAIEGIHARGVVYNDLHLRNVIVRPDGRVALVDFEVADELGDEGPRKLGAAGYAAPLGWTGPAVDRWSLACLKVGLFLPLEALLGLDRAKAVHLAGIITDIFPIPTGWLDDAVELLRPDGPAPVSPLWSAGPDVSTWPRARADLATGILASATPQRSDRLFPGDVAQFTTGGLNLAHGAAGVLYALDATGAGRHPELEEWLIEQATDLRPGARLGFYDGFHGVAHVLARLGHHAQATRLLDICLGERWEVLGNDLAGGLAGIGLNLAHFADITGDPALADAAERATQRVADRLGRIDDVATISGGPHPYAGLLNGSSGPALLFLRMYERTGADTLLDLAATALRQDLRRCVRREGTGALHVDEGWRSLPYLAQGSVGIGLVLRRYLAHHDDDELREAAEAVRRACLSVLYVQAGLFNGRAGIVTFLSDGRLGPEGSADPEVDAQIARLGWHAFDHAGGVAFAGDQLRRLSMDLATGSAGVLLALGAARADHPVHLPFLGSYGTSGPARAATTDLNQKQLIGRR
jgi:hypothetical protein